MPRKTTPRSIEARVLTASKRRCCICYYLHDDESRKKGQIAHLGQNATDSRFENLVWLCLDHHDEYDSTTSQSKNLTVQEVKIYRDRLYKETADRADSVSDTTERGSRIRPGFEGIWADMVHDPTNQLEWLDQRWQTPWERDRWPLLFAFKAPNLADGICRVERVTLPDGRKWMLLGNIDDNPGVTVTNAVEHVAFQVAAWLDLDVEHVIWLEYYAIEGDHHWSRITFAMSPPEGMFAGPAWHEMTRGDWHALGVVPRELVSSPSQEHPNSAVVGNWEY